MRSFSLWKKSQAQQAKQAFTQAMVVVEAGVSPIQKSDPITALTTQFDGLKAATDKLKKLVDHYKKPAAGTFSTVNLWAEYLKVVGLNMKANEAKSKVVLGGKAPEFAEKLDTNQEQMVKINNAITAKIGPLRASKQPVRLIEVEDSVAPGA